MRLELERCVVRSFRKSDAASLAGNADNRKVWRNLRDRMPFPYRLEHARDFIAMATRAEPETSFAIAVEGTAVGSVGLVLQDDIHRFTAEIGYWLGEPFWGRGITSDAVAATTLWAIETFSLTRVFAVPFTTNAASCRVLEKAGFELEGTMRRSALKDGVLEDQFLYAFVPEPPPAVRVESA